MGSEGVGKRVVTAVSQLLLEKVTPKPTPTESKPTTTSSDGVELVVTAVSPLLKMTPKSTPKPMPAESKPTPRSPEGVEKLHVVVAAAAEIFFPAAKVLQNISSILYLDLGDISAETTR